MRSNLICLEKCVDVEKHLYHRLPDVMSGIQQEANRDQPS